jgi:hypothetical protein
LALIELATQKEQNRTTLICWGIWQERNAHIFNHVEAPSSMVIAAKIREEVSNWVMAEAKHVANLVHTL